MAVKEGEQWTNIQALPFNIPTASFGHPAYHSKKQRLYFASDMEGGAGQKDIYYCDLVNGVWGKPVNMKEINSGSNELFPFFS
ncbi:MAG: hypothetical protein IPG07_11280 [Crocinitomicaceae bacterium]|nr:hypothetical protein [Crocinitomicaceae bacterium]